MKKTGWLCLLLFGFIIGINAQKVNDFFPLGQYMIESDENSQSMKLDILDEQYAHLTVKFDFSFFDEQQESPSLNNLLKYVLRNDTLYFEQHDDSTPYLCYYTLDDISTETSENIQLQIKNTHMFTTYAISVISPDGGLYIEDLYDRITDNDTLIDVTLQAKAGDTLSMGTSMGGFDFVIPEKIKALYLTPNKPNLGIEYAYKGESVNELILKTGLSEKEHSLFYKDVASEIDLSKFKEESAFDENKIFIQASKRVPELKEQIIVSVCDADSYATIDDGYSSRKDTIRYVYSYNDALKIAKEENLFIRIFYMKEKKCLDKYLARIRELNKESYYYDNEYNQLKKCILVFLDEKAQKQVERLGITKLNTDFIVSVDEILLHQKKLTCKDNYYGVSFFSSDEDYLMEELEFIYLNNVLSPQLIKNPNNVKALKLYLDKVNQISKSIDYYSYDNPWSTYLSNRSYYFKHIDQTSMPSSEAIISYLNNYTKAKMDAPADTSLIKMIISFYNIIYGKAINSSISSYTVKYLIKHEATLNELPINEHFNYKTLPHIIYKILANPVSEYENEYTPYEIFEIYQEAITLFPKYADYFYLLSYKVTDLSAVSPGLYPALFSFYKDFMQKQQLIPDRDRYLLSLKEQINLFEANYGNVKVHYPEELYRMLPHLAWIIGIHEGEEGENIKLALECARIASEQSIEHYPYHYITPNYVALLYLLGEKEKAIATQKAYCVDKSDSYSPYDQKMMLLLKEMILGIYEPRQFIHK